MGLDNDFPPFEKVQCKKCWRFISDWYFSLFQQESVNERLRSEQPLWYECEDKLLVMFCLYRTSDTVPWAPVLLLQQESNSIWKMYFPRSERAIQEREVGKAWRRNGHIVHAIHSLNLDWTAAVSQLQAWQQPHWQFVDPFLACALAKISSIRMIREINKNRKIKKDQTISLQISCYQMSTNHNDSKLLFFQLSQIVLLTMNKKLLFSNANNYKKFKYSLLTNYQRQTIQLITNYSDDYNTKNSK